MIIQSLHALKIFSYRLDDTDLEITGTDLVPDRQPLPFTVEPFRPFTMHAEHGYGERISKTAPNTLDDERKAFREGFRITIVGAGIVGLALASFLRRSFFPVTVLEQDEALKEVKTYKSD